MSKPYDAASKDLLQLDPAAWAGFVGVVRPPDRVALTDSDLSAVTAAADKVVLIRDAVPWLLDIEFQSWRDPTLPRQLLKYNALLHDRHKCPVASVLIVLAESADSPAYTGRYGVAPPFGPAWDFGYTVVRVWEASAEALLAGPLALAPLAPVSDVALDAVPDVIRRLADRASGESDPATTDRLLTAVGLLLRLRYGQMTSSELISRYPEIREMAPFKKFLDEGRVEGRAEALRAALLRQGRKKLGKPSAEHEAALAALTDLVRLEALTEKILDVTTWGALLEDA
ncbi:RpnC/YadD family protein [Frigoriglobus tundricola]|uniref:DUF4351 domain-containing protein n=1 Tax=Frigoriglobus tundricola TaxID=2774151 RepID=A0A6M5YK51_9BACT|nr:hypothetical protein [Frigoriglobus tundricola]QJW93666.1 hypothetical protein FTUN_1174 [Frigoriglobus tundricola]